MKKIKEDKSLEKLFSELDNTVSKLEDDNISLDEMIVLFEKGMKLVKACDEKLKKSDIKIKKILTESKISD
ncbi:MAG: exodeoxyribonuclease VII small subunit [Candidatus Marinimicrobia bacterium]|nr:exodeoxyribonuclease VII small subunit [Candidatus Neomarinimicrobiota bacterium]